MAAAFTALIIEAIRPGQGKCPIACRRLSYVSSQYDELIASLGWYGTCNTAIGRLGVPKNGETNKTFGVYKNLCCGAEIVIPENVTFPDCSVHVNLPTE